MAEAITIRDLRAGYRPGTPVLEDIRLELPPASFVAVVGPNGSGKSTLLRAMAGLLVPDRGHVRIGALDPARVSARVRARHLAYLPQREPEDVPFTALELALMGRFSYQGILPFDRAADVAVAERCLELVGAAALRDRLLSEMSGGERQKIHLARALAQEPLVLLLDEPASSLDLAHQVQTYRLLSRLHRDEGKTIVLVSHDLNLPAAHAQHVLVLSGGRIAASGPPGEILRARVLEPIYGTRILEAEAGSGRRVLVPEP